MERIMSVEDKIRKAEEIYYRRRNQEVPQIEKIKVKSKRKDFKLFKKMIIQIIICLFLYSIFYVISTNNYIFSEDFTNAIKEVLAKDINFSEIYSIVMTKYNELINQNDTNSQNEIQNTKVEEQNTNTENNEENIGGAEEILTNPDENIETNTDTDTNTDETSKLSQMEQDANYIKSTISFIKPVTGTISSQYGLRNPTTSTVPKNHTGTDIATTTGTKIVSATDGTVILASSEGDYGNHLKIQINDVIIVYAHCNKLYVNEGDVITQGQKIAEVGSTGNTTGPHLHFEVRYQDRYVDPELILDL